MVLLIIEDPKMFYKRSFRILPLHSDRLIRMQRANPFEEKFFQTFFDHLVFCTVEPLF